MNLPFITSVFGILEKRGHMIPDYPRGVGGEGGTWVFFRWVCAAQRGRDFDAPDLERGIHFRGVF